MYLKTWILTATLLSPSACSWFGSRDKWLLRRTFDDDKDKSLDLSSKSAVSTSIPIYDPSPFFPKDQHKSNGDSTTALQDKDDDNPSSSSYASFDKDKDSSSFWNKDATTAKPSSTATETKDDKSSTDPAPFFDKDKTTSLSVVSTMTLTEKLTTPVFTASTSDSSPFTDKDKDKISTSNSNPVTDKDKDKTSTSPSILQTTNLQSSVSSSGDDKDMRTTATAIRSISEASISSLPAKDSTSETSISRAQSTHDTGSFTTVLPSDKDSVTKSSTSATHFSFLTASSISKASSSITSDDKGKDMTSQSTPFKSTIYSSRVTPVSKATSINDKPSINVLSDTVLSGSSTPIQSSGKSSRASSKTGSSKSSTMTFRKATLSSIQSLTRTSQPPFLNESSSVVPLWTPTMLGNAYGGGYITTPSIYVTLGPTPKGSVHGIPPGYGSSTFSIGSSQISGSYISSSTAVIPVPSVSSNPANSGASTQALSINGGIETSKIETDRIKISSSRTSGGDKDTTQVSQASTPKESGPQSTLSGEGSSLTETFSVVPRISTSMTTTEGSMSGGRSTSPSDMTILPTSSGRRASTDMLPSRGSADKDSTATFGPTSIIGLPLSSLPATSEGSTYTSILSSYSFEDKNSSLTPGLTSATNPPLSSGSTANPLPTSGLASLSNSNDKPPSPSASLPQASARSSSSNDKYTASSYSTLSLIIDTFPGANPTLGTLPSGLSSAYMSIVETKQDSSSDSTASSRPGKAEPTSSSFNPLSSASELSTGMTNSLPVSPPSGSNTLPFTSPRESGTQTLGNNEDSSLVSFQPSTITSRDFSIESSLILSSYLYMTMKDEQTLGDFTSETLRVTSGDKTSPVSGSVSTMLSSYTESFSPPNTMGQGSMSTVGANTVSMTTVKPSASGSLSNDKGRTGSELSTTGTLASSSTIGAPACPFTTASACPTPANSCCPYICTAEGVPFSYCSLMDVTGIFADGVGELQSCSMCPGSPAISTLNTATVTSAVLPSLIPTTSGSPSEKDQPMSDSTFSPMSNKDKPVLESSVFPTSNREELMTYSSVSMMTGSETATITSSASLASSTLTCPEQSSFRVNCPATFSPCCAYVCGGKALPFGSSICLRSSGIPPVETCLKCPSSPATATSLVSDTNKPTPDSSVPIATESETATITSSTALPTSVLNCPRQSFRANCPTTFDPCCAFLCGGGTLLRGARVCVGEGRTPPFGTCQPCSDSPAATSPVGVYGGMSNSLLGLEPFSPTNMDSSASPAGSVSGTLESTQADAVSTLVLPSNSEVSLIGSSPALMTVTSQGTPVLVGALGMSTNIEENNAGGGLGSTVTRSIQGSSQIGFPNVDSTSAGIISTLAPNQVGGSPSDLAGSDVGLMAQAASTPSTSIFIVGGPSEFASTLSGEVLASYLGLEATMSPANAPGSEYTESPVTAVTPLGNGIPSSNQSQTSAEAATPEDTTDYSAPTALGVGQPQVIPFQPTTTANGNVSIPFLPTTFAVEPFLGLAVKNNPALIAFLALLVSLMVLL